MAELPDIPREDQLVIEITKGNEPPPPVEADSDYVIPGEGAGGGEYTLPKSDRDQGNKFSSETQSAYSATVAASRGEDPVPIYQKSEGLPPDVLSQQARDRYLDELDVGIKSVIDANLANQQPDEFTGGMADTSAYYQEARDRAQSARVSEIEVVENVSKLYGPGADEVEKKVINQMYFRRRMGEILKNQGYDEWASNAVGLLIWSDESSDVGRTVTGSGLFDPEIVTSWFNSAENWQKFVSAFAEMSAEEQVKDFEAIVEVMKDTHDDNAIKIAGHLAELVDPSGADTAAVWHTLDKAFLVGTVAGFAGNVARVLKSANLVRTFEQLDNVDLAAKTVRMAAQDGQAAKVVGLTRGEAAEKMVPFDNSVILEGAPSSVAHEVVRQQELITEYTKIQSDVANKFVTAAEAQVQATAAANKISKTPNISDVKVTSVDEGGFTLDYKVGTKQETFTKKFTIDDFTGEYVDEDMGILKATTRGVWSPNFLFNNNRKMLVNEPERILRESASAALKFKNAQLQIFKGLSKASVQKVNAVLARGRDNERVYSYAELVGSNILTKQEFNSYALSRHLFDIAYTYEDVMVRNKLIARGIREVEINDLKELLKPADSLDSAKAMLRASDGKTVYIPEAVEGDLKYGELTSDLLETYHNLGYTLARGDAGTYIASGGDKYSDFVLVKNAKVKDIPGRVLSFRPGYAPIDYKNGVYFVKTALRGTVGDASKIVGLKTHRYFDNLTDANTFAEELKVTGYKDAVGNPVIPKGEDVQVMHNRQMAQEAFEEDRVRIFGGMYNSARAGERLTFGLGGEAPELVDPLIAMTDYFDHLSKNYPMHLFRMQMEQTWMNTARTRWGLPHEFKGTFKDAIKHISDSLSTTERAFAQKSHMQTALQMSIPTTEERAIRTWTRDFAEGIETGKGLEWLRKPTAKLLHKADSRDPVNIVTGVGFNLVLGMWNFSTMVVQGLGLTIAATINPLRIPVHLGSATALSFMDEFADPTVLNLVKNRIGGKFKDIFPNEGYIADLHKSWGMSGLRETVISGNPEYAALKKNLPYDRTLLKKALNTHTMFYGIGEGFNYRYAWGAAFDWWKLQKGNGARKIDQGAVDEIRRRADTYLLHMNRANRATPQTGAWRIPSQFTQILFRFQEALMGKELTSGEKTRLLLGQSILFGAAGVPFANSVIDYAMEKTGTKPDEATKDTIRSGVLQHFVQEYLGLDVDIANRASIMKGIYDETLSVLFGGESLGSVALGAPGGIVGARAIETVQRLYNLGRTANAVPDSEDIPPAIHRAAVDAVLDNANSWRSLTAAREVVTNRLFRDRRGNILVRAGEDDINLQTKIAMALGLRYDKLTKIYIANMDKLDDTKRAQEKATSIISTIDAILNESKTGEANDESRKVINLVIDSMLENEIERDQRRIRQMVLDKMLNPTTSVDRLRRQQLEDIIEKGVLSNSMTPSFIGDIK